LLKFRQLPLERYDFYVFLGLVFLNCEDALEEFDFV
jgi:hypothetical protein